MNKITLSYRILKKLIVLILLILAFVYHETITHLYYGMKGYYQSKNHAKYYILQNNANLEDITQKLIDDESVPEDLKKPLLHGERRIVIFKYPSGGEYVAGYLSYIPKGNHPTLIFLRGGNGYYGIMRPNNKFSFLKNYNVVSTLYRGNIYGGKDEFGGKDVQDIENLIKYFPHLEQSISIKLETPFALLGISRGAMEMVAALSQSSYVKEKIHAAISVSGGLDLNVSMHSRPEMAHLYKNKFHESKSRLSFTQWISKRNPINNVRNLSKSLKILLIYGLNDQLVSLKEQENFKKALENQNISVQFITIPGANHGLDQHYDDFEKLVLHFLNQSDRNTNL